MNAVNFSKSQAHEYLEEHKIKGIDEDEFHRGLNVELEHGKKGKGTNLTGDALRPTALIALAHLNEIPDYYTRLKKMEDGAKSAVKGVLRT